MRGTRIVSTLLIASIFLGSAPEADTLCLEDGRILENVRIQRSEGGIVIEFENGRVTVPDHLVRECIIANDPGFVPESQDDKDKIAAGLVRFQGQWVRPAERDRRLSRLLADNKKAIAEMKESRLWRNRTIEESKNLAFEYTVPQHIFESYEERMEAYMAEIVKLWKIRKARDLGKLKVRFYIDPDYFYQITGVSRGVLAFFEWTQPPYRLQFYYDRLDPSGFERYMYHEFGHYLQKLIDEEFKYSHWPGESLAEYYSTARWDPKKKKMHLEPLILEDRLIEIRRDIESGERVGIREMITGANNRNYHDYSWGWSFVHFLMSKPATEKKFTKFYLALARSKDIKREAGTILKSTRFSVVSGEEMYRAFKKYMGLKKDSDVQKLEGQWYDYVENQIQVETSRGLARAAQKARQQGRMHRARRLYEEAVQAEGTSSLTFHRYAELLDDMDEDETARGVWADAVALDPLVPEYYIAWGKSLLKDDATKEEGKRLLLLAREIEPDNLYLENNLERLLEDEE